MCDDRAEFGLADSQRIIHVTLARYDRKTDQSPPPLAPLPLTLSPSLSLSLSRGLGDTSCPRVRRPCFCRAYDVVSAVLSTNLAATRREDSVALLRAALMSARACACARVHRLARSLGRSERGYRSRMAVTLGQGLGQSDSTYPVTRKKPKRVYTHAGAPRSRRVPFAGSSHNSEINYVASRISRFEPTDLVRQVYRRIVEKRSLFLPFDRGARVIARYCEFWYL